MTEVEENRRVLAVDDDENTLNHYRLILAPQARHATDASMRLTSVLEEGLGKRVQVSEPRKPYQLDCFDQGEGAVSAVEQALQAQQPYTVALVDMRMLPGIDGMETARRIRALDSDIFIIFVTAYQ
jgi:CheY-like chemotaxis protein